MGKTKRKKRTIARICSMIGVSLLILVILICIPLTLPRLTGFDIYTVVTGSMEPAIPVGSLIYVREEAPAELMEGEVVAYRSDTDAGIIITHRVVKNQVVSGQLITKGDANEAEDISPVSYAQVIGMRNGYRTEPCSCSQVIGKVTLTIPVLGGIFAAMVTFYGKIVIVSVVLLAAILLYIGTDSRNIQEKE